jgi:hypothetical protein
VQTQPLLHPPQALLPLHTTPTRGHPTRTPPYLMHAHWAVVPDSGGSHLAL